MELIDITMAIETGMDVYKGRLSKSPVFIAEKNFESDGFMESSIKMNMHTGTHVDAPLHFIEDGDDISSLPLDGFVGNCRVLDMMGIEGAISRGNLQGLDFSGVDFVLFKTENSMRRRPTDFVYLDESAAESLSARGLKGVGIDSLGIERDQAGHPTHKKLFNAGMIVIEGLDLKGVSEGEYFLIALPLKIKGAEAAPARVVLLRDFTKHFQIVYNEEK